MATSAYQIEGAVDEGGRGPSIWDTFAATPGRVVNGDNGDVAVDHYHRFGGRRRPHGRAGPGGLPLLRSPGRGSSPTAPGPANPAGLDFYDRLVDSLARARASRPGRPSTTGTCRSRSRTPGGWPVRDTAYRFADYAAHVADALGDRVRHFITLNEPWCSAFLGYGSGRHAPGRTDGAAALAASHHLLLGHGLAVQALRERVPDAQVGVTLNLYPVAGGPRRARHRGRRAAHRRADEPLVPRPGAARGLPQGRRRRPRPRHRPGVRPRRRPRADQRAAGLPRGQLLHAPRRGRRAPWPGTGAVEFSSSAGCRRTATGWEVDPDGLVDILTHVTRDYGDIPLVITENGAAFDDEVGGRHGARRATGSPSSPRHLAAAARAMQARRARSRATSPGR